MSTTEVGTAYVTLVPSAKGFAAKMQALLGRDITDAGRRGGDDYGRGFTDSGKRSIGSRAKGMFAGLAKAGAAGAALAGAAVGKVLFDSIAAASDLDEVLAKSSQLFGAQAVPGLEKWAASAATAMGQSKQQALDAASTFAIFGKAAGLTGKDLASFSMDFTGLASDLASFNNTTPQQAIEAIGAALRGETEPIRAYGVMLDDASLRQEALRQGLIKTTKDALTPQQKTLAAQALIYKQTKDAQGDFARTSGGLANQQRILSAQWENMKGRLGRGLLPVALRVVRWANDLIPRLGDMARTVKSVVGPAFTAVRGFIEDLFSGGGGDGMDKFRTAFTEGLAAVQNAAREVFPVVRDFIVNDVLPAAERLGRFIGTTLVPIFAQVARIIATQVVPTVVTVVKFLAGELYPAVVRIATKIGGSLAPVITTLADVFKTRILPTVSNLVQTFRTELLPVLQPLILRVVTFVGHLYRFAAAVAGRVLPPLIRLAGFIIAKVVPAVAKLIVFAVKVIARIVGFGAAVGRAIGSLVRFVGNIHSTVVRGFTSFLTYIGSIPGKIIAKAGRFASAGKELIQRFLSGIGKIGSVASGFANDMWNAVKGVINKGIDKLNGLLEFDFKVKGIGFTVNAPDIPHLATGGRATAASVVEIGEGSEPETVLPDSVLAGFLERMTAAATANLRGGGGGLITITNWDEGIGYFEDIAGGVVDDAADLADQGRRAR